MAVSIVIKIGSIKPKGRKKRLKEFSKSSHRTSLDLFVRYGMSLKTGILLNQNMQMPWIAFKRFCKIILLEGKFG